jgi:hypothetical protein
MKGISAMFASTGSTQLFLHLPRAVHEGNSTMQLVVGARADARSARRW